MKIMTPAQRRKRFNSFKKNKTKKPFSLRSFLFPGFVLLGIFLYVCLTGKLVSGNSKVTVVVKGPDQIRISTFDRDAGAITNLLIPASTQVNVSRQLGTWKIGSVWQLGENERLEGALLSETILKNFNIPVNAWADEPFIAISDGKIASFFRGLLPYKTNLGVGDKLRLIAFSISVPPAKRVAIDLSQSVFLKETRLVSGEDGYVVVGSLPQSLYYLFSDARMGRDLRVEIQNHSKSPTAPDLVVSALGVLGAKVSAITKADTEDFMCEVSGKRREIVKTVAGIFECKESTNGQGENFDLTIKLGEEFARRY